MATLGGGRQRLWAAVAFLRVGRLVTNARLEGRFPVMDLRGRAIFGPRVVLRGRAFRSQITVGANATLTIGAHVLINQGATIWASESVTIGARTLIGDLACIYDTNAHAVRPGEPVRHAPVVIEEDVWIGRNAVIMPGVTVGRGSVIGAQAVVTKSVPAGSIVVGPEASVVADFSVPPDFNRLT